MRKELSRLHLIRPQEYVNNNFEVSFGEVSKIAEWLVGSTTLKKHQIHHALPG